MPGSSRAVQRAPSRLPFNFFREQNIDTHQVGRVKISINKQGDGSLEDFWSNGKPISGNTFYAIVVLVGKGKAVIWSDKQTKGIDGSWGGHAREAAITTPFHLDQTQTEALDHVEFKLGVMNCGMEITEFHCCDKGIEVAMSTKKCDTPRVPRPFTRHAVR